MATIPLGWPFNASTPVTTGSIADTADAVGTYGKSFVPQPGAIYPVDNIKASSIDIVRVLCLEAYVLEQATCPKCGGIKRNPKCKDESESFILGRELAKARKVLE